MRALRPALMDTADLIHFYDGSSKHRDVRKLTELDLGNPVSGDDLALIAPEEPK